MMTVYPRIVHKLTLSGFDPDGRPCEVCGELMREHEWALMDINGFVVFCCNLTFSGREGMEIHSEVWYVDDGDGGWESPQSFIHLNSTVQGSIEKLQADIDRGEVRKGEIYTFAEVVYTANKKSRAKLGNWNG